MSTGLIWQTISTSSSNTERLGRLVGSLLSPPACAELASDLGGGKTTFVRGWVAGLKSKDTVASPTFTLSKVYKSYRTIKPDSVGSAGSQGGVVQEFWIHHYDFYRLNDPGILRDELAESLADDKVITIVEWSDIVADVLPDDRLSIKFAPTANDPDERQITINYPEKLTGIIKELETKWAESQP